MKHHFNKISQHSPLRPWSVAIFLASMVVVMSAAAVAFEPVNPSESGEDSATLRFQEEMTLAPRRAAISLDVYRTAEERRRIWHVALRSENRPTDALCRTTLPVEVGDDDYQFELRHVASQDSKHLLLLEARTVEGSLPPDQPVFQIAFQLQPHESPGGWRCNVVARGEHTQLDGGPVLSFDEDRDPPQLIRKNVVDDVQFCGLRADEDQGYERFDPPTGRFVPGARVEIIMEDAGELQAHMPSQALVPPLTENFYTWISASSDIRGAPVGAAVPRPLMLGDHDTTSAWVEGSNIDGVGEFVTAGVNPAAKLRGLRIFPGHGRSAAHYQGYANPKKLLIGFSDGYRYTVDIPRHTYEELRSSGGLYIPMPEPIITRCVSVMILESHPGELTESTDQSQRRLGRAVAISEITPYSSLDAETESETARRIVGEMARESIQERRDRIARFGNLIPDSMIDAISEVLHGPDETRRMRTVPLLGELHHEKALPVLQAHILRIPSEAADYRITKRTIAVHGSLAAATLLEILEQVEKTDRKYVDTVRLIGRVGSDVHLMRLIDGLGEGDDMLRRERIRAIASGGTAVVPRLISVAESESDTDAGFDALSALVFVGQRLFHHAPAEIEQVDDLRRAYLRSSARANRIRAIEALGYFIHPEGVALLGGEILAEDKDPVVRQFAASSLRLYSEDQAREYLEEALLDPSPDVRIAAIRTLSRREDSHKATDSVATYAAVETWPRGLHYASQLLARSPEPLALETLAQIVVEEVDSSTAATALRSLRREEKSLPLSTITKLLAEDTTPHRIMRQLVDMLALTESSVAETTLLSIASSDYRPISDRGPEQIEDLSQRAMLALGSRGGSKAWRYLLAVLEDDSRSQSDRSYALRGMAFVGDADLLEALQKRAHRVPPELRPRLRETINQIRGRLAIEDAERDLHQIIETLDERDDDDEESPQSD